MTDGFDIAQCPHCAREVLLAFDLVDDELVRRCLHCDTLIAEPMRTVGGSALADLGYVVEREEAVHGSRGCRDGQCGVSQERGRLAPPGAGSGETAR